MSNDNDDGCAVFVAGLGIGFFMGIMWMFCMFAAIILL